MWSFALCLLCALFVEANNAIIVLFSHNRTLLDVKMLRSNLNEITISNLTKEQKFKKGRTSKHYSHLPNKIFHSIPL